VQTLEYENAQRFMLEDSDEFVRLTYPPPSQRSQILFIVVSAFVAASVIFSAAMQLFKAHPSAQVQWWFFVYFTGMATLLLGLCVSHVLQYVKRWNVGDSLFAARGILVWTPRSIWRRPQRLPANELIGVSVEPVRIPAAGSGFKLRFHFRSRRPFDPPVMIVGPELPAKAGVAFRRVLGISDPAIIPTQCPSSS
jgi:hypothetical protein